MRSCIPFLTLCLFSCHWLNLCIILLRQAAEAVTSEWRQQDRSSAISKVVLTSTERSRNKPALPAKAIRNVSLRVQSSWPWLIFPWLIDLVGIYTHGFCDSTSPYTYITFPGEVSDGVALLIKSFPGGENSFGLIYYHLSWSSYFTFWA